MPRHGCILNHRAVLAANPSLQCGDITNCATYSQDDCSCFVCNDPLIPDENFGNFACTVRGRAATAVHARCQGMSARALGRASFAPHLPEWASPLTRPSAEGDFFQSGASARSALPRKGATYQTTTAPAQFAAQASTLHCFQLGRGIPRPHWFAVLAGHHASCPALLAGRKVHSNGSAQQFRCLAAGFADCNSDGSCTATTTTDNCGGCGRTCPSDAVGCDGTMCLCPDGESC